MKKKKVSTPTPFPPLSRSSGAPRGGRPKGSKNRPRLPRNEKQLDGMALVPQVMKRLTVQRDDKGGKLVAPSAAGKMIRRFVSDRSIRRSIRFLERIRDGKEQFEDVRLTKDGDVVRFKRDAPADLRQRAAEWLAARRVPSAIPAVGGAGGIKAVTVIVHQSEPEI